MTTDPAPHSRWTLADTLVRARETVALYLAHETALVARVPAGYLDALNADRALLGDTTAIHALTRQKTATAGKLGVAHEGHDLVMLVRDLFAHKPGNVELKKALGVGEKLNDDEPVKVRAGLQAIVERGPELLAHGVTADDLTAATTLAADLAAKHNLQGSAITARHDNTSTLEAAHLRAELAVRDLARIGPLAFRGDAVLRQKFHGLLTHTASDAPAADPTPAPPEPATPPAEPVKPDPVTPATPDPAKPKT